LSAKEGASTIGAVQPIFGHTTGLAPSRLKMLERVYRRRVPPSEVVTHELGNYLCEVSREIERQVGVLIDRRGQIEHVVVGDAHKLYLPDVGRMRAGRGRFRGLRLVVTHLRDEPLTRDDLTDLSLLRLDLVCALGMDPTGRPAHVYGAHLLPENPSGKLYQDLPVERFAQWSVNFEALISSLEQEFARKTDTALAADARNKALIVHVPAGRAKSTTATSEARVAELEELCRTAGVRVVGTLVQRRAQVDPKYVLGRGKLEEVVGRAMQLGADLVIFDPDLTPGQARAITDTTELKVIDRTMLILDIFAQRAKSRDGKIQVELAQLKYTLPRLVEKNTMMSRLTGGIGGRGPGETKLELSRRRARERIHRLEEQIEAIGRHRAERRKRRSARGLPVVAIVGYTNAGKSTLLNTLTQAEALVEDKLFATLDPQSRRLRFPRERELILTDTVGFIRDLPKDLQNAFRATLEELDEADLLVHLIDAADPEHEAHIEAVQRILADLNLANTPALLVFNKLDLLPREAVRGLLAQRHAIGISARDAESTRRLLGAIERALWQEQKRVPESPTRERPRAG
jgi:GTP-binding protein HflX